MKRFICLLIVSIFVLLLFYGCNNSSNISLNTDNIDASNTNVSDSNSNTLEETDDYPDEDANSESDFEYTMDQNNGITITKYIGNDNTVIIPKTIDNNKVTKIGVQAFFFSTVTSLRMPNSVTIIDNGAFQNCNKLQEIYLSNTLVKIGQQAFENCTSLKSIELPSSIKTLGEMTFMKSGLETVKIEDGIEKIPSYAFAETKLNELILPPSVKAIDYQAFGACENLEFVTLNDGLITIGHKAFVKCTNIKELVIPKTVTSVTEMAFTMCSELKKVMFEGNAPNTFEYSDPVSGVAHAYNVSYTIYYHENATGFSSPKWYGYTTEIW